MGPPFDNHGGKIDELAHERFELAPRRAVLARVGAGRGDHLADFKLQAGTLLGCARHPALAVRVDEKAQGTYGLSELDFGRFYHPSRFGRGLASDPDVAFGCRFFGVGVNYSVGLVGASTDGFSGRACRRAELICATARRVLI